MKYHSTGIILILLGALCLFAIPFAAAQAPTPTSEAEEQPPTPGMFPLPPGIEGGDSASERLAPPPMPENPAQADLGAQVYYQVCMVCHGDRGQGLTDEWRGVLDPEDQDCWQSGCHHTKHPEGGFIFPKIVPPVAGAEVLSHYPTALHLHDYIQARMPWQARGTRSADEYWQLTAFLLRLNGADPGPDPLNEERAAQIVLNPAQATALARPVSTNAPASAPTSVSEAGSLSIRITLWIVFGVAGFGLVLALALAAFKRVNKG